jgi:predicted ATPase
MPQLCIKNFGPIKDGCTSNPDSLITFNKITLFIGPQGSGKSTVAKLYSTFLWIEKALSRGDFTAKWLEQYRRFQNTYCKYQNIQNYFQNNTYLLYKGNRYNFTYVNGKLYVDELKNEYHRPQIMYVPAERNLLSVTEEADRMRYIPQTLFTLIEVYNQARRSLTKKVALPIKNLFFSYDKLNHVTWLEGKNYKIRLSESSSGFQSLAPLIVVIGYLWSQINENTSVAKISVQEQERFTKQIENILARNDIDEDAKAALIKQIPRIRSEFMINIIEEPEQNLFPDSQKNVLYELLAYANKTALNQFVFTTHSPYVLSYLTLAVKAGELLKRKNLSDKQKNELNQIVPVDSALNENDISLYQIKDDGTMQILDNVNGLPDDDNYLNNLMAETNNLFSSLLDMEN